MGLLRRGGCGNYLLIQNILDAAVIGAYAEKYGEIKKKVDFYWLDDSIEEIELGEDKVTIHWRDGEISTREMDIPAERYRPTDYANFYNKFLECVRKGEKKVKYKFLMGLSQGKTAQSDD